MTVIRAVEDPHLSARLIQRWPLVYDAGPDPALDRPAHVRAGSALVRVGDELVVVQDDTSFLAVVHPATRAVRAIPLPAGPGGLRQFDKTRGNKMHKLDLEAAVPWRDGLLAFGSGSAPGRDRIALAPSLEAEVTLVDAGPLYAALAACREFAGPSLNIEGAVRVGPDTLRLVNRGNGAPVAGEVPVDAAVDLSWSALLAWLQDPHTPPPPLGRVRRYALGRLGEVRLSFTDATASPADPLFLAAAEDSPDAVEDGPVVGVAVGVLGGDGARWTRLRDLDGRDLTDKAEGLCLDPIDPYRAWAVFDLDDPSRPTEIAEVHLEGRWFEAAAQARSN